MNVRRLEGLVSAALCVAALADASMVPGGKNPRTDCYARFRVGGGTELLASRVVTCADNDARCDNDLEEGTCLFDVALCLNQSDAEPACVPPGPAAPLAKVKAKGKLLRRLGLQPPDDLAASACGDSVRVPVLLARSGRQAGTKKIRSVAVSSTRPRKDRDVVTLRCEPGTGKPPTACEALEECANPQGGPDQLDLAVGDSGTDLDNGWTGVAHNFLVPPRAALKLCLSGCDADTNPVCDVCGPTGVGSLNGPVFGTPLPLVTQSVPVCVVNRYQPGPITGKVNVQTGTVAPETPLQLNLFADVHFTFTDAVCPRCVGPNATDYGGTGTCDGGENAGGQCTVESILTVALADGDALYRLSSSCPPSRSQGVGTLDIRLPLTTGTSTLSGSKPCQAKPGDPSQGVVVRDDACAGSACAEGVCSGPACVRHDARNRCLDAKGGISQSCCNGNTTTACFPTANGGSIQRTGNATRPKDAGGLAWPDGTYPKTSPDGILVATFCEAATTANVVNVTTGLPGPGALELPGSQTLIDR